jgi:hypothetical protein
MNFALIVYRCGGDYLYCAEEYKTCSEVEQRIADLVEGEEEYSYRVYCNPMEVRINPPRKTTVTLL